MGVGYTGAYIRQIRRTIHFRSIRFAMGNYVSEEKKKIRKKSSYHISALKCPTPCSFSVAVPATLPFG